MRGTQTLLVALAVVVAGAISCGDEDTGETGVSKDKDVGLLSASELDSVCDWVVAEQGGATKSCPGDVSIHLVDKATCVDHLKKYYSQCSITVAQVEACASAVGADPCTGFGSDACAEARACGCGTNCPSAAPFP